MKKRLFLLSALLLIVWSMCCACGNHSFLQREISADQLKLTFDLPAKVLFKGKEFECRITHDITQSTVISLTGNSALNGLQYQRSGGEERLEYQTLSSEILPSGLPENNWFTVTADILDFSQSYVNLESIGDNVFQGSINGKTFLIQSSASGDLESIDVEDFLSITFFPENT